MASKSPLKSVKVHVKVTRVLYRDSERATGGLETVAEEWECLQGPISTKVGRVSVVEANKVSVEARRVLIKAVRVPL
jgi:hypothetical protein